MVSDLEWWEFRLWYGDKPSREALYQLRSLLLPILDKHSIQDFLVLNEPDFALFRVEVNELTRAEIEESLRDIAVQSEGAFSKVTTERWSPENNARERILGAAQRLGLQLQEGKGWKIVGREPLNRLWIPAEDDLEAKTKEFAIFMTKVAGQFTRAYVKLMPRRIEDRWLLSVLFHLLLNSISLTTVQEGEIREFPYA